MAKYIVVHGIRVAKDFVPETFGRLTTIGPVFFLRGNGKSYYRAQVCQCECGQISIKRASQLATKKTRSCGCLGKENLQRILKSKIKHGKTGTSEYRSWKKMISRCYSERNNRHYAYGGRGIEVCQAWRSDGGGFSQFYADMGPKPTTNHEIERKDVNGNYYPENCCWVTAQEQARNTRTNVNVTYNGKTQCVAAWAEEIGMKRGTLQARVTAGWTAEAALTTPVQKR